MFRYFNEKRVKISKDRKTKLIQTNPVVDFFNLFRYYIYCRHMMMLGQQCCYAESHVAGSGYCDSDVFEITHIVVLLYFVLTPPLQV